MAWIVHHNSVYGGRVPLPDSILIEQAKTIVAKANLDFDPGDSNFSSKWLYKFKMHNNIKHTNMHGEGEATDLTSVAIVWYCRLLFMFFMLLLLLHDVARRGDDDVVVVVVVAIAVVVADAVVVVSVVGGAVVVVVVAAYIDADGDVALAAVAAAAL